ncbi:MAG: class I adenylate-forming enzyme family protein [Pseudomonadota bacterium]
MNLFDALDKIPREQTALIDDKTSYRFSELCNAAQALAPHLDGARLVINSADLTDALKLMVAADGCADAIALIPPSSDLDVALPLLSLVEPDVVFSREEGVAANLGEDIQVVTRVEDIVQRGPSRSDGVASAPTDWIMATSGTTSTPKLVTHNLASLTRTTRPDIKRGSPQVWGLLYDFNRFAGLQVVLQSLLSGACLLAPLQEDSLDAQLHFLASNGCTHLSATPSMWRKVLMSPESAALPLLQITLGGEIADDLVLTNLGRAYPEARISHIFASTEAGVGFSVTDKRAGFPASFLTEPPSGIGLKIEDDRLFVRNEQVSSRYLGDRGAISDGGWVDTGDSVEQDGNRIFFRGRASGVINVGGNKVHPEEVEHVILTHPDVEMARVFGKPSPVMGQLVVAEIVPAAGAPETLKKDVMHFLRERLQKHMVPFSLKTVHALSMNAAGKLNRKA